MAITFNHLTQGSSSLNDQTTYTTGTVTPATDGTPIALWIVSTRASGTVPIASSIAGLGLTWSAVQNGTSRDLSGGIWRISLWKGVGTASTGTCVLTMSGAVGTGVLWSFVQMPGADPTFPFGPQTNKVESTLLTAQTSTSLVLPGTPTAGNAVLAAIGHKALEDITAGTDFTKATNSTMSSPTTSLNYEYKTASLNTTVDASWATSSGYVAAGDEVFAINTGTGAFAAAAAVLAGTGTETITGTGDLAGGAASFAGTGSSLLAVTGTGAFVGAAASFVGEGTSIATTTLHASVTRKKKKPPLEFKPLPPPRITGRGSFKAAPCLLKGFGEVGPDPRLLRDDLELLLLLEP